LDVSFAAAGVGVGMSSSLAGYHGLFFYPENTGVQNHIYLLIELFLVLNTPSVSKYKMF
jgi:hypothetical protein